MQCLLYAVFAPNIGPRNVVPSHAVPCCAAMCCCQVAVPCYMRAFGQEASGSGSSPPTKQTILPLPAGPPPHQHCSPLPSCRKNTWSRGSANENIQFDITWAISGITFPCPVGTFLLGGQCVPSTPCLMEERVQYLWGDMKGRNGLQASSADACCQRCRQTPGCTHWSWHQAGPWPGQCWL